MNRLLRCVLSIVAFGFWVGISGVPSLAQTQCKENESLLFDQEYSLTYQLLVSVQAEGYDNETEGKKRFAPLISKIEALKLQLGESCSQQLEHMLYNETICTLLVPVPLSTGSSAVGRILTIYEFNSNNTFALGTERGFFEYSDKTHRLTQFMGEDTGGINAIAHDGGTYKFGFLNLALGGNNGVFRDEWWRGMVARIPGDVIGTVSAVLGSYYGGPNGFFRLNAQGELAKVPGDDVGAVRTLFGGYPVLIGSSNGLFSYDWRKGFVSKAGGERTGPISIIASGIVGGPAGAFHYDSSANLAKKISGDETGAVKDISVKGRDILIGAKNGLFGYDVGQKGYARVKGDNVGAVNVLFDATAALAGASTVMLVGSEFGLFRYEKEHVDQIEPNDTGPVTKIFAIHHQYDDEWLVVTEKGLFVLSGSRMTKLLRDPGPDVFFHRSKEGEEIVGLRGQLFYLDVVPKRFAEKLSYFTKDQCFTK
jgi:hypothetical protein